MMREIERIVERQLGSWDVQQKPTGNTEAQKPHERPNVITISCAVGCECQGVGDQVAARLGVLHHDRDIIEHIASAARVRVKTVESLDQRVQSRIDEYIESLLHERNFDRGDYMRLLGGVVAALWKRGPCVFSGHGSVHLVPRDHALAVRLAAPPDFRAQRLAEREQLDERQARRKLQRADAEQEAFHRRYFGTHVDDSGNYDLVIDVSRLSDVAAVDLIVQAYSLLFPAARSTAEASTTGG